MSKKGILHGFARYACRTVGVAPAFSVRCLRHEWANRTKSLGIVTFPNIPNIPGKSSLMREVNYQSAAYYQKPRAG